MRLSPTFLLSATDPAHFPNAAKTHNAPEAAFLGRSNVGKSSLINALLGSKQAHVSSTPGRTRAINFFSLHEGAGAEKKIKPELILADLPGYGYAKISKSISAEWPKFIEPYLAERETLALCVCLIDITIPPQGSDAHLMDFLRQLERSFVVVGTKADKLSSNMLNKQLALHKREHQLEEIIPCSAKTGAGLKTLWSRLMLAAGK